ncbi:hypothetical protein BvCmsB5655_03629 [Escherichia coli]|uniref:hypothetical protein n=1 Tax=Escherichia coli TaxID=562 RepID=UPI0010B09A9B|nr:hypothetical protein [Escherichia coli]GCJ80792.1 hypothetical protein BvCmsB5655_03629 [Escherichia coli]HDS0644979.1 hypothetical protein [Escherichia coli]
MITFEEPEVVYCFSVKGFEYMMDSILKDTYLVQIAVTDNTDNALQRVMNMYEKTSRRLCAMKRIEEIKVSRLNK